MELVGTRSILRPFRSDDAESIAIHLNNYKIWINVTDQVPHPYGLLEAQHFIARSHEFAGRPITLAITVNDTAVGVIGFRFNNDVRRRSAEIGYWLGEPYWNRGIMTEALRMISNYAFRNFDLDRLEAHVFAWNPASAKVLLKAGYVYEGRLRKAIVKDGKVTDDLIYGLVL